MSKLNYRPEIDGIRAIAVLSVIFYHAGFGVFSGGYLGVDIFFVLSGYLISTILLNEINSGNFSLVNFYERRARRILPMLFFITVLCIPFAWFWLLPADFKSFSQSVVAITFYLSNIFFWKTTDYFSTYVDLKPLIHTWSLAIEEQFYLIFPFCLLFISKLKNRWKYITLAVCITVGLLFAHRLSLNDPKTSFYFLHTRAWELMVGAFVALHLGNISEKTLGRFFLNLFCIIGLLLVIIPIFVFDKQTPTPSFFTAIPVIGVALLITYANRTTWVGRLLATRFLVGIGLISYSAYLWHQPIFAFTRHRFMIDPSSLFMTGLILVILFLSYLSWQYIEKPFRDKRYFSRAKIVIGAVIISVLLVCFGLLGHIENGFPNRAGIAVEVSSEVDFPRVDNGWCFYSIDSISSLVLKKGNVACELGSKSSSKKALLFGDSYAGQYEPFWDVLAKTLDFKVDSITTNWCFPSLQKDFTGPPSSRAFQQCLINRQVVSESISSYDFVVVGGSWGVVYDQGKINSLYEFIKFAASRTKFVVIMPTPKQFDADPVAFYKKSKLFNSEFDVSKIRQTKDINAKFANNLIKEFSKNFNNVIYLDRDVIFSVDQKPSDVTIENMPFSSEGLHISIYGSKKAAESFLKSEQYQNILKML